MKTIKSIWLYLIDWFEHGDLVPLLVLVSAVHYASVLGKKDYWLVAIAIGLLVDLGHYRTIRAAVRYNGDSRRQALLRWVIAAGMTGLSLNYHQRYYNDFWLSAPLPLLIAALAWLQRVDSTGAKRINAPASKPDAEPVKVNAPHMRVPSAHLCETCEMEFTSQQALAAHMRWKHQPEPQLNGKAH